VDLDLSDDQGALRSALRDFFEKEAPTEVVRAAEPLGFDPALWRKVVGLGLGAIAVPEERGGGGAGFVELVIAAEILGRTLAPAPLIEAAVATSAISACPATGPAGDRGYWSRYDSSRSSSRSSRCITSLLMSPALRSSTTARRSAW
jgi:alkylation response protein AidB-like acyl-CoA dehydrogenase